jgi:hypothetical protein
MATSSQPDHDSYRAIVLRDSGADLLTVPTDGGLALPSVEIPRWQRVPKNLTGALRRQWDCEAICLFAPKLAHSRNGSKDVFWQVMECRQHRETSNPRTVWIPVSCLSPSSFRESPDYIVLHQALEQLKQQQGDNSQPFLKLGWFHQLHAWVTEVSRPLAVELTGKFCQFNASPAFSLIRFETTGPALWFKAVGDPNQHEFPITIALSRLFPRYLPTIVASRPAWRGWLMKDGGTPIDEINPTLDEWRRVAADLARLQIESIPHSEQLLKSGSTDLGISRLFDLVDPFLDTMDSLMRQQQKPSPPPLSSAELFDLGLKLKDSLDALDQMGSLVTLGHSDFHPGNVLWTGTSSLFIDWAEAYVGHPFCTFEYLVSYLRSHCPEVAPFEDFVRTAYTQPWKHILPAQLIAEAFALSPLIAVFAYAVVLNCWRAPESQDPQALAYLRSLTRRMKREADLLAARRMPCLQF